MLINGYFPFFGCSRENLFATVAKQAICFEDHSFIECVKNASHSLVYFKEQIKSHIQAELCLGDGLDWLRSCINQENINCYDAQKICEAIAELAQLKNDFGEAKFLLLQASAEQFQLVRKVIELFVKKLNCQLNYLDPIVIYFKESLLFVAFCATDKEYALSINLSEKEFNRFLFLIRMCNENFHMLSLDDQRLLEPHLAKCFDFACEQLFHQEKQVAKLYELLTIPLSSDQVDKLFDVMLKKRDALCSSQNDLKVIGNAFVRYEQLKSFPQKGFEKEPMQNLELFEHALFIEAKVVPVNQVSSQFFEKKDTQLTHDIQVDYKKRRLFIIADINNDNGQYAEGKFKTPLMALRLKFDVNIAPTLVVNLNVSSVESKFFKAFCKRAGIVHLLHGVKVGQDSYSLMFEKCDGSFHDLYDSVHITIQENLSLINDILLGLEYIHAKGFAHGDLHLGNMLYKRSSNGDLHGALCDFGHTQRLETITKRSDGRHLGKYGSQDSVDFTSKYVLGKDAQMTEMFALGSEMCKWYFQSFLPRQSSDYKKQISPYIYRQMKLFEVLKCSGSLFPKWCRVVSNSDYVKTLVQTNPQIYKNFTINEKYEWLMFSLLAPPEKRLDASDALNALSWLMSTS
jgi:hypothetical protein